MEHIFRQNAPFFFVLCFLFLRWDGCSIRKERESFKITQSKTSTAIQTTFEITQSRTSTAEPTYREDKLHKTCYMHTRRPLCQRVTKIDQLPAEKLTVPAFNNHATCTSDTSTGSTQFISPLDCLVFLPPSYH